MTSSSTESPHFLHSVQMGIGTWSWGDRVVWQYGSGYGETEARQAFRACIGEGIRFIDTAEVYGSGRSERLIGKFAKEADAHIQLGTKFFPWPWRLTRKSMLAALRRSLARVGAESVDLYQVHWPTPLLTVESLMEAMVLCVEAGLARSAGVCNFSQAYMLRAYSALARQNVPLVSNQVHYSLLRRQVEKNGLLARCRELGIRLIACSPLEMGLLTGKYTPANPPPGNRGARYGALLNRIAPLLRLMTEIGQDHGGKSNAQVALNWVVAKGALPIPGAKSAPQAIENAGALGWKITKNEMAMLDAASEEFS